MPLAHANTRAVQRYGGALLEQSGPSCWLFVTEAIADQQGLDTWLLAGIIYLYPQGYLYPNTRANRLTTISAICGRVVRRLQQARARGDTVISRDNIRTAVQRSAAGEGVACNYASCVTHLFALGGNYLITDVVELFRRGRQLAAAVAAGLGPDETTPAVMGGAATVIDANSDLADIGLTLAALPHSYLSVSNRYRPMDYPANYTAATNTYDLTGLALAAIRAGGAHAILLHSVNQAAQQLTYKDPNYGDAKIVITFAQLREMARLNGTVSVRGLLVAAAAPPIVLGHAPAAAAAAGPVGAGPIGAGPAAAALVVPAPAPAPAPAEQSNMAVALGIVVTGAILAMVGSYIANQSGRS